MEDFLRKDLLAPHTKTPEFKEYIFPVAEENIDSP
jgi:hypothetical protein